MKQFIYTSFSYLSLTCLLLCAAYSSHSQTWIPKTGLTNGYVFRSSVFTIGEKVFVANTGGKRFFEYDATSDTWNQKADMPSTLSNRNGSASFTYNGKGYIAGGSDLAVIYDDLWEYDPATDQWTQKSNLPAKRSHMTCFTINDKIYLGGGIDIIDTTSIKPLDTFKNDFWEYNPATDSWMPKANIPYDSSFLIQPFMFAIGGKGYISCGGQYHKVNGAYIQDTPAHTYEYDPATDLWTQKADFPGRPRRGGISFVAGNKAYCGYGWINIPPNPFYQDLYIYDPAADKWYDAAVTNPFSYRKDCIAAVTESGRVFAGRGLDSNFIVQNDWWELEHHLGIEKKQAALQVNVYPNPCSNQLQVRYPKAKNETIDYELYNLAGKKMADGPLSQNGIINTSLLPNGFYLLVMEHRQNSYRQTISVQHE